MPKPFLDMYSTTVAKNSGIPLFSCVSRRSGCSTLLPSSSRKLRSFSCGLSQMVPDDTTETRFVSVFCGCCRGRRLDGRFTRFEQSRCFSTRNSPSQKITGVNCGIVSSVRTRAFSVGSYQNARENGAGGCGGEYGSRRLPWLSAAYSDGKKATKVEGRKTGRSSKSSWEKSASKFFSKNGGGLIEPEKDSGEESENASGRRSNAVTTCELERTDGEDDEDDEPINDPRWDKIQLKYQRFVERDVRSEGAEVARWKRQENWVRKTWKEATESSVPKLVGEGVYGVGPVLLSLKIGRRDFYALYVQEGLELNGSNKRKKRKDKESVEKILRMAEKMGVAVKETSKHNLNMVVDNRPHQGLVLDASPLEMVPIKVLDPVSGDRGGKAPIWVALDEVTDPQNLGAILRSSYFFGAEGVVVCAKNSAPLSGVVSKASAGALELMELRACKNMMQFLTSSGENGWRVLGGSISPKSVPLDEVQSGVPTILVLGSEGAGLRPLVERSCTQLIRVPGRIPTDVVAGESGEEGDEVVGGSSRQELGSFLAVESLNVSVAAGVLLYRLVGNSSKM